MIARQDSYKGVAKVYYKCTQSNYGGLCTNNHILREERIESVLTGLLFKGEEIVIDSIKTAERPLQTSETVPQLESRLKRLGETYTDGLIDRESYKRQLADIRQRIETIRNTPSTSSVPSPALAREILKGDLKNVYEGLDRQKKRRFWLTVLQSAEINADLSVKSVKFF